MNASRCAGFWALAAMALAVSGVDTLAVADSREPYASRPDVERLQPRPKLSGVRKSILRIEAETLVETARASAGLISAQQMGGFGRTWSGGAQLFWQSPDPVDTPTRKWPSLTLNIEVARSARYALEILHTRAPDYGDVRVFVGGAAVADLAGHANNVEAVRVAAGDVELRAGKNQIVLTVFRRPPGSRGSYVGLDALELTALDIEDAAPGGAEDRHGSEPIERSAIAAPDLALKAPCPGFLERYAQQVSELGAGNCDRFADARYRTVLESKQALDNCPLALASSVSKATYASAGTALRAFAERCTCQQLLDNMDANLASIEAVLRDGCMSPLSASSLTQALDNIAIESTQWTQLCRGVVSATSENEMRARQERANSYAPRATARCGAVTQCTKAAAAWQTLVDEVQKRVQDNCEGHLHADIATAGSLRAATMQSCPGGLWQSLGASDARYAQTVAHALDVCSTRDMVMNHRCPWTRETKVHRFKKIGSYEKNFDILVREHWCKEEPDYANCVDFEQVHIEIDKGHYVVVAHKDVSLEIDGCVAPSVWSQCKAISSSTGQCVPQ